MLFEVSALQEILNLLDIPHRKVEIQGKQAVAHKQDHT